MPLVTLGICTTGIRFARIENRLIVLEHLDGGGGGRWWNLRARWRQARVEGIAHQARSTHTVWLVVVCSANGIEAAQSGTRILALATYAGSVGGALAVGNALGPAVRRSTQVVRQAAANSIPVFMATLSMGSAGRWPAGIDWFALDWRGAVPDQLALSVRTSCVARLAHALRAVVNYVTHRLVTTSSGTRIPALLVHAGPAGRTLRIADAFWSAGRWTAVIVGQTGANSLRADFPAFSVGAAGRGLAGMKLHRCLEWSWLAEHKRIAVVAIRALAHGQVIVHLAGGARTASSRTRIQATIADAGLVPGALCTQDALWAATHVRVTLVQGEATANTLGALGIGATWGRYTRIVVHNCWRGGRCWCWGRVASVEGIAYIASWAGATGHMVEHITLGVQATSPRTRVHTSLTDASPMAGTV